MKKVLLGVAAVVGVLVVALGAVMGSTFGGLLPSIDGPVSPGVQSVRDGYVNAFLVDLDDGVALVDCGNDPEAKAILAALTARSLTPASVKAIFITHGHPDHVAGCKQFPSAMVYGFEEDRALMEGTRPGAGPIPKLAGVDATKTVKLGTALTDGADVQVGGVAVTAWRVPGHTQGSAAYLAREVLFLGDSATGESGGALRVAPWVFSDDTAQCRGSLVSLAPKLPRTVKRIAFAHSGPVDGLGALSALAHGR